MRFKTSCFSKKKASQKLFFSRLEHGFIDPGPDIVLKFQSKVDTARRKRNYLKSKRICLLRCQTNRIKMSENLLYSTWTPMMGSSAVVHEETSKP